MSVTGSLGQGFLKGSVRAGLAVLALTAAATMAQANPLNGTFNITIYQESTGGALITDAREQANPSNPMLTTAGDQKASGTYTGNLDFNIGSGGTNTIGAFFASGGGTTSAGLAPALGLQLSTGGFDVTTLFQISGTSLSALQGFITHDDGIGLFNNTKTLVTPVGDEAPTASETTNYSLPAGSWALYYIEANGLPAVLDFEFNPGNAGSTPLPAALPLFATGLGLLGVFGRRRKQKLLAA